MRLVIVLIALLGGGVLACSKSVPINRDATGQPTTSAPPTAPAAPKEIYPGIILDRGNQRVDVRATVVGRNVEWLELLATRPGMREYESVVALDADATQIHLALTLLGLEAGQPASTQTDAQGQVIFLPPHGPALELFFLLDDQPDTPIPANTWIANQETGEPMSGNTWVYTGSKIVSFKDENYFMAEKNGTVVSLVNFGDELVSRPTEESEAGGNAFWTTNPDAIPPLGTRVTLRFKPAKP